MKKLVAFLTFLIGLSFNLQAAGPVTHVVLADRYMKTLPQQPNDDSKRLFMLGTIFPDIRYLGTMKRTETHFKGITLQKVQKQISPFQQGMLFHSFVDEYRDRYARKVDIHKKLTDIAPKKRSTFLKLVEDQILRNQYNWADMRGYLTTIPDDEKQYGVDMQSLAQWHAGLTLYFTAQPSTLLSQVGIFEQGILSLDAETVKQWSNLIPKYAQDPVMQAYVAGMLEHFDASFI
jgi:hypothetical protein